MTEIVLNAAGLRCGYDERDVLRGVDLSLPRGGFFGVIGPNGSGKSTLIKALTGLLPLRQGAITLSGRPMVEYPARELARWMAVVPQISAPVFAFTVREIVEMGRHPHLKRFASLGAEDHQAVDEALALTDLTTLQHRTVDQLSGGEYQRVTIARALAQHPKVMLLDEPTAHLDIGHQVEIFELLGRLNEEQGMTVLCILHDLNLAAEYCRHLLLFSEGRVYIEGTPTEVLTEDQLMAVYGTLVRVQANPYSGQPVVLINKGCRAEESNE